MVFASLVFLYLFFPLNLILYFSFKNQTYRNCILIIFSLVFYAWGEPVWIFPMVFTAFLDYANSKMIYRFRGKKIAKLFLLLSIVIDVGIFALFKYSGFIVENINTVFKTSFAVPGFALPIGISFYTFQTLTYVVDVYKGRVKPAERFYKYLVYLVSYFQLVAGPIVRYTDVEKAVSCRKTTVNSFANGMSLFIYGLAKKVMIANIAGEFAGRYMHAEIDQLTFVGAWFGIIMYTVQLYFDFSGYSDMAKGLGKIFGFDFPDNFNYPYISKSVSEFWRRWHMTLGGFFRDYVYIPLGGNRKRVYLNLFIVWFLTGLWHGASWNFVIWGLYNGFFIILERLFAGFFKRFPAVVSHIYLLVVVNIGFVFFYFEKLGSASQYLKVMFSINGNPFSDIATNTDILNNIFFIAAAMLLCTPVFKLVQKGAYKIETLSSFSCAAVNVVKTLYLAALLLVSTAFLAGNSFNPFLYFQF